MLPWVCLAVAMALCAVQTGAAKDDSETARGGHYMTEGMCLGLCFGLMINAEALSCVMLIGLLIGLSIRKEEVS